MPFNPDSFSELSKQFQLGTLELDAGFYAAPGVQYALPDVTYTQCLISSPCSSPHHDSRGMPISEPQAGAMAYLLAEEMWAPVILAVEPFDSPEQVEDDRYATACAQLIDDSDVDVLVELRQFDDDLPFDFVVEAKGAKSSEMIERAVSALTSQGFANVTSGIVGEGEESLLARSVAESEATAVQLIVNSKLVSAGCVEYCPDRVFNAFKETVYALSEG